jgi:two-component system response regulator GlrR
LLISRFLEQATEQSGLATKYSPKAMELLMTADWPGNVRQLFDLVKQNESTRIPSYDDARDEFSRGYLVKNLQSTAGNVTRSARLAKRNRTDFYKLLSRYRILAEDFKRSPHR